MYGVVSILVAQRSVFREKLKAAINDRISHAYPSAFEGKHGYQLVDIEKWEIAKVDSFNQQGGYWPVLIRYGLIYKDPLTGERTVQSTVAFVAVYHVRETDFGKFLADGPHDSKQAGMYVDR